jgi:uncharacterized circularly permuted ATP-grasp superfamily protein
VVAQFHLEIPPVNPNPILRPVGNYVPLNSTVMMDFSSYDTVGFYDELFDENGAPRPSAKALADRIESLPDGEIQRRQRAAEAALLQMGITFTVYGEKDASGEGTDRVFPFDIIPRIVGASDWDHIERGLRQRIQALNLFIDDIYHDQKIVKDGVVPEDLIRTGKSYRPEIAGLSPPKGIWCHVTGTDLVRDGDGTIYVLEDNMRSPSGVSYVLENRQVLKRTFPKVFATIRIRPVDNYPSHLFETLQNLAPDHLQDPTVVVLSPGVYNSAYFEHSFLAQQMGIPLVEGRDLVVRDGYVSMRETTGLKKVDVIYRRIDDDFIDPKTFRPDSMLGVPGIIDVYRKGNVALANAPGTGIADDKAVYAYVPQIVKYYLGEETTLANVPTYICREDDQRKYVIENLDKLVVKAVNESGGYGMLVGPHSTQKDRKEFAAKIEEDPRNYIAQPTLSLSRVPTIVKNSFEGRHVDLRPYILYGKEIYVLPGGLTRVALRKGSLVVNSSQGGGSKDTWVVDDGEDIETSISETGVAARDENVFISLPLQEQ